MRAGDGRRLAFLAGELVQPDGETLRRAAGVHEDDRRAVLSDELEQLGVHGRPDRALSGRGRLRGTEARPDEVAAAGRRAHSVHSGVGDVGEARLRHALDRHLDLKVERLAHAHIHDPAFASRAREEAADLLERALRGGQAYALQRGLRLCLEPLERQREVGAALCPRDGVDLVDDHPLHVREELARPRREHEVERLGRRDQHVRRRAQHRLALSLGGVAGADRDADVTADPLQRGLQVLLDVVGEGLQRRDVDEPRLSLRTGLRHEAVETPEEGGERLARAGGRRHEHVLAGGDSGPRLLLRGGGPLEAAREPVTHLCRERAERIRCHATIERTDPRRLG